MKRLFVFVLALSVLAACASPADDSEEPAIVITDPSTGNVITPTGNAVNPVPLTDATLVEVDGNFVRLSAWMGVEPCDVIDRVEVTESDANVDIEIFRGVGDVAATCIAIAVERIIEVQLDAPLGDRTLTLSGVEL
jgi:hypothetical protein